MKRTTRMAGWAVGFLAALLALPGVGSANGGQVEEFVRAASSKAGGAGIVIGVLEDGQASFYSAGYAHKGAGLAAGPETHFELASVSKAYTGLGILLLEKQGLVSLDEPVATYLPWLEFCLQGEAVPAEELPLSRFLHHTSGLTNGDHAHLLPQGNSDDMLEQTVKALVWQELSFRPGERFAYGTMNYDVLGLVLETVSGQSYEDFMASRIFTPLGLENTFAFAGQAEAAALGYKQEFFRLRAYEPPAYRGNKPAGYLLANGQDLLRWAALQLGQEELPEEFAGLIERSHQPDSSVAADGGSRYGAGWMVSEDGKIVEHGGNNPNFTTHVLLEPEKGRAVIMLCNSSAVDNGLAGKVSRILDGETNIAPSVGIMQLLDWGATVLAGLLALACLALAADMLRCRREIVRRKRRLRRPAGPVLAKLVCQVFLAALCLAGCIVLSRGWSVMVVWLPMSAAAAVALLGLTGLLVLAHGAQGA